MKNFIQCIDPEWCQDGHLDFAIVIDSEMLLEPKFGFGINKIKEEEYNKTSLGTFWCADTGFTWLWAIASSRNPITERTRRTEIGSFNLWDSETGNVMPNTKIWRKFKKEITPMINKIMKKEVQKR